MTGAVQPEYGDFGVVATAGKLLDRIAARLIRWDTDSPVNHAFIYIGNGQIIEAANTVRNGWANEYEDIIWSTGRLPAALTPTAVQRHAIGNAAAAMVGEKYNWLDIIAIGLAQKRMGHVVDDHSWSARRLSKNGREICSQLVDDAYQAAGIHLFQDGRPSGLVSPGDLYRLLLPTQPPRPSCIPKP